MNRLIAIILVFLLVLCSSCSAETRLPAVAGTFYPSDSTDLSELVGEQLQMVPEFPALDGQIIALIVPHAGLVYSGIVAAHSYRLLLGSDFDKVILCGPSHRYGFEGISVSGPGVEWVNPLGKVRCNHDLCQRLIDFDSEIKSISAAHAQEHCLEVQLPFLQTVMDDFEIVPLVMGYPRANTIQVLAEALESLPADDRTVMVASTDWQHYRPAEEGWKFDSLGIECLKSLDPDRLAHYLAAEKVEACGGGATVAVMKAAIARGANRVKVLKHGDSGDVTGDKSSVVGYIAAVLYKSEDEDQARHEELPARFELSAANKAKLLEIARESIKEYLTSGQTLQFEVSDELRQPGAGFVTLEKHEHLRGCIGYTEAVMPLYQTISDCAIKAAVSDHRFPQVQPQELDSLHIEISVLTPLQLVKSLDEIEVGQDGLMIFLGPYRGLLLPQVATDYGWTREEFLQQTCRKAGLGTDAYKSPDAKIYKFQAVIFGE